jgi:hypothetical protein
MDDRKYEREYNGRRMDREQKVILWTPGREAAALSQQLMGILIKHQIPK